MKCEVEGVYVRNKSGKGGRVIYPKIDAILRTDECFRDRDQIDHHSGFSNLKNLSINMVDDFCIDPMHLVYLRVMRKLIYILVHRRKSMK
jgi:hypothetical protein